MRSETSSGSGDDELKRKEKGKWKEKVEEKVGGKVIHTGAVWIRWSEEAKMRFPDMLLQFLMPVCQH